MGGREVGVKGCAQSEGAESGQARDFGSMKRLGSSRICLSRPAAA